MVLKLLSNRNITKSWSIFFLVLTVFLQLLRFLKSLTNKPSKNKTAEVCGRFNFWVSLFRLLRQSFRSFFSVDVFGLVLMCFLVFKRAQITIKSSQCVSRAGRHLIEQKYGLFTKDIKRLAVISISGTIIHVGIWYVRSLVKANLADNLHEKLSELYFRDNNLYRCSSSGMVENPDSKLEGSTRLFCGTLVGLIETTFKPIITVATLSYELFKLGGIFAPAFIINFALFVGSLKSVLVPNLTTLMNKSFSQEARLQEDHNNLIRHAEEVAFYCGENRECERVQSDLLDIITTEKKIKKRKAFMNFLDELLNRHCVTFAGFILCSFITQEHSLFSVDDITTTEVYLESANLTRPLLGALTKLLSVNMKIAAFCASVKEVSSFEDCLLQYTVGKHDKMLRNSHYQWNKDCIQFLNTDIITPSKEVLIRNFSLNVKKNEHVLILGSNGCGKTAIIRALVGFWPIESGLISLPSTATICICPHRVYFTSGCLKKQLTFPINANLVDDSTILEYAHILGLDSVVERVGGLYTEADWSLVLSGGEKQRIGLTRVLIRKPTFAFLDECTSEISVSDEVLLYEALKHAGITLISVSQRLYLKEIHNIIVSIHDNGEVTIDSGGRL